MTSQREDDIKPTLPLVAGAMGDVVTELERFRTEWMEELAAGKGEGVKVWKEEKRKREEEQVKLKKVMDKKDAGKVSLIWLSLVYVFTDSWTRFIVVGMWEMGLGYSVIRLIVCVRILRVSRDGEGGGESLVVRISIGFTW